MIYLEDHFTPPLHPRPAAHIVGLRSPSSTALTTVIHSLAFACSSAPVDKNTESAYHEQWAALGTPKSPRPVTKEKKKKRKGMDGRNSEPRKRKCKKTMDAASRDCCGSQGPRCSRVARPCSQATRWSLSPHDPAAPVESRFDERPARKRTAAGLNHGGGPPNHLRRRNRSSELLLRSLLRATLEVRSAALAFPGDAEIQHIR